MRARGFRFSSCCRIDQRCPLKEEGPMRNKHRQERGRAAQNLTLAFACDMTMRAEAPSLIEDEFAAVTLPCMRFNTTAQVSPMSFQTSGAGLNAGLSCAIFSIFTYPPITCSNETVFPRHLLGLFILHDDFFPCTTQNTDLDKLVMRLRGR
eukprot:750128-Hanusia_phi.AAC.7